MKEMKRQVAKSRRRDEIPLCLSGEKEEVANVSVREHTVGDKGVFTIADFVRLRANERELE